LLRVLENGTFRRIGGTTDIKVDVRIISATNKDLNDEIAAGRFREDLFYRLNVVPVVMPPLRERKEDIPLLITHFLNRTSDSPKKITPEAMRLLIDYTWKGNVRELENVIERVVLLTEKEEITSSNLPPELIAQGRAEVKSVAELTGDGIDLEQLIVDIEKKYLLQALEKTEGIKTDAAKLLGLSFRSFRHRLQKYGIN
jgi:DNA-binding NtrC family response regulator